jgi:hypothetical protein
MPEIGDKVTVKKWLPSWSKPGDYGPGFTQEKTGVISGFLVKLDIPINAQSDGLDKTEVVVRNKHEPSNRGMDFDAHEIVQGAKGGAGRRKTQRTRKGPRRY